MSEDSTQTRLASQRKKFLINPKLQLTVIGFNLTLAFLAIGVIYAENVYLFKKFTGADFPDMEADPIILQMIQEEQVKMNIVFAITSIFVLCLLVVGGLILSNRIAGPIYRLHKHMSDVVEGKTVDDVVFRKKDYFQEVAQTFNRVLKIYRGETKQNRKSG